MPKASCFLCRKTWTEEGIKMYKVPKDESKRKKWSDACGKELKFGAKICGLHFSPDDFLCGTDHQRFKLSFDALPMIVEIVSIPDSPKFVDASTQTEFGTDDRVSILEHELERLQTIEAELLNLRTNLESIFTPGQMRKLEKPTKILHWSWKDMSAAIALHSAGPRAYTHLLKNNFPLPCESSISKWCQKLKFEDGILNFSIGVMRSESDLPLADRICVLCFDEMKVESAYEYDYLSDSVRPPSKYVQVVIARGLKFSWKQPVFSAYDCRITKLILLKLIEKIGNAGFPVVAVVSDMGAGNQALWSELSISYQQTYFTNPANGSKVFVFADAPHLLKLLRNHFLDTGLVFRGDLLTSRTIADILNHTAGSDVSIAYKVTEKHLKVHHEGRQKVKLAAQLFSHSIASAIRRCYSLGRDVYKACETADFIEIVNNWFDVCNTKLTSFQGIATKKPFGISLAEQMEALAKMDECMKNTRVFGKNTLLPFQKGILLWNEALRGLYQYINNMYGVQYILTYRLNQDILEHFFGAMRFKGGMHTLTAMQFKYRLRKYLLACNTEALAARGNVEADDTEWIGFESMTDEEMKALLTESGDDMNESTVSFPEEEEGIDALHEDGLEYIAGYIIRKLGLPQYISTEPSFTWVDQVSRGALTKPSSEFLEKIKELETIFGKANGMLIKSSPGYLNALLHISEESSLSEDIKKIFFRTRMHIRIKYLNKKLK